MESERMVCGICLVDIHQENGAAILALLIVTNMAVSLTLEQDLHLYKSNVVPDLCKIYSQSPSH